MGPRQRSEQRRRLQQVAQPDVVGAERAGEVGGEAGPEQADGAGRLAVEGGVHQHHLRLLPQERQEVEPAGAAVHQPDPRQRRRLLQRVDGVDPHALVPHQEVADAEDQQGATSWPAARPAGAR